MLTITKLKSAVESNKVVEIKDSLRQYGLPKNGPKTTDYLLLKLAIRTNKTVIAKLLINAGCRVNRTSNDNDFTPLASAIQIGNEELATLLLEKGANLDAGNNTGSTVLHLAAEEKLVKMLNLLLRYQTNVNHIWNGKTPFQIFLETCYTDNKYESKHTDIIRLFLAKGATVNFKIEGRASILHLAVDIKQNDIIKRVLQGTDNVNEQDDCRCTALHNFLKNSKTDKSILEIVKCFVSKGAKVDIQDYYGNTVCHLAAKKKYLQILQIFLQCQWDVNCCNQEGNTVLHCILINSIDLFNDVLFLQLANNILKQEHVKFFKNDMGKNPLHIAAENKQSKVLLNMLLKPVDIDKTDDLYCTTLYLLMKTLVDMKIEPDKDDVEVIKKLILMGTNPAAYHLLTRLSPLHLSLKLGNKEIILLMLQGNIDFDKFDRIHNRSILHYLIYDKMNCTESEQSLNAEIAEICIKKGATVDMRNDESSTPLNWAVTTRQKHMIKVLLENGADPNFSDSKAGTLLEILMNKVVIIDSSDSTVFKEVHENIVRDYEIVQMLLSKNAIAENVSEGRVSIFHYCAVNSHLKTLLKIISYSKDPNIRDSHKNTILHALLNHNLNKNKKVEKKLVQIFTILISRGADISAANEKGEIPLHLAAKSKHLEVSKILLKHKADITKLDNDGNTVLHFLCMLEFQTIEETEQSLTELFISKECDINAKNNNGMTPLHFAAQSNAVNMIRILIKRKAKIDCLENKNLSMPIHLAAENNHQESIQVFIDHGVNVNIRRGDRKTALHISVIHSSSKVTRFLLENGADPELKDSQRRTPLHYACWYESLDNICELLDYGADVNVEDNFQITPIMLTRRSNDVWMKLRVHMAKLKSANMFVSSCNKSYIEKYYVEHRNNYMDTGMPEIEFAAINETLRMEKVPIAPRISLADVLKMSATKLSFFKNNEEFQKLLNSNDFIMKFPIYADLIEACYRKGIIRNNIANSAKEAFRNILGLPLPDTCCDAIFQYLDNDNLDNLDKAAKVIRKKKKKFVDDFIDGPLPKRVRKQRLK